MAKKEEKTINFRLGDKRAIWASPDKKISLSRFTGLIYGSIDSDDEANFNRVQMAISNGDLVDTKEAVKKKVVEKEEIVDITNIAEKNAKNRRDATRILKSLKKDELLKKISEIKNPYLIASMIEQESRGRNVSKRRREDVIKLLKEKLEEIGKNVKSATMFKYLEETDEGYKVKQEQEETNF